MDYKQKYLKYKSKYLNLLKDQKGGKPFLSDILAQPAYLWLFYKNQKQLEYIFSQRPISFNRLLLENIRLNYYHRLSLIAKSGLSLTLASRLVNQDIIAYRLKKYILSRLHNKFKQITTPTCVATLEGHVNGVHSVAFHPSLHLLVTGSWDTTAKVWHLVTTVDGITTASCMATFTEHSHWVTSVAFHPSLPILATRSADGVAKMWRLVTTLDGTVATGITAFKVHTNGITSVTFHPSLPFLATSSLDGTAKVWRLEDTADGTIAICITTSEKQSHGVTSVVFHPSLPLLATSNKDKTVKIWRLNGVVATCVATLSEHSNFINTIAFHPSLPFLATGSADGIAKIWRLSPDGMVATCIATLSILLSVYSVAFHPSLPILATSGYNDKTAKMWHLVTTADGTTVVTCVATLVGHSKNIYSVAFDSTGRFVATGSRDMTVKVWRL